MIKLYIIRYNLNNLELRMNHEKLNYLRTGVFFIEFMVKQLYRSCMKRLKFLTVLLHIYCTFRQYIRRIKNNHTWFNQSIQSPFVCTVWRFSFILKCFVGSIFLLRVSLITQQTWSAISSNKDEIIQSLEKKKAILLS